MDWRLIVALTSAGGSICLAAVGALAVLTGGPVHTKQYRPAPTLISERQVIDGINSPSRPVRPAPAFASNVAGASSIVVASVDVPRLDQHAGSRLPLTNGETGNDQASLSVELDAAAPKGRTASAPPVPQTARLRSNLNPSDQTQYYAPVDPIFGEAGKQRVTARGGNGNDRLAFRIALMIGVGF